MRIRRDAACCVPTILLLLSCRGFGGVFTDKATDAFRVGAAVSLPRAGGGSVVGTMIDVNGDGVPDGIDLDGDGVPEILFKNLVAGESAGLDLNGDGAIDYYLSVDFQGNFYLSTAKPVGNATSGNVAVTTDTNGTPTGFNTTGSTTVDDAVLGQIYTDATPPTTAGNNAGGTFTEAQTVTLTCSDDVACNAIVYTTDGTTPSFGPPANGVVVAGNTATVTISSSATLQWLARDAKGNVSGVESVGFVVDANASETTQNPILNPSAGVYASTQSVSITSSTPDAVICYTNDGVTPSCNAGKTACATGTLYSGAFNISSSVLIKTMACKAGINDSSVVNSVYTFGNDPVVIYTSPTDNATGVLPCDGTPCRAKIILQFDRSMNTGLLAPTLTTGIYNGSSYINAPVNTTHIWKTTRYSNDTLTLHLSWVWFPENSKIQWSLDKTNLKDTGDNGLTTNVQQTFTTTGAKQSFSLADTGQTTCYNDSGAQACGNVSWPGQDADYADTPNARSFTGPTAHTTYTSDYTTKDNITSLVWKSCTEGISGSTCSTGSAPQMTWYNALNQCATLNTSNSGVGYAGRTDWRLPTMRELEMLPNLGVYNPAIDTARFPATVSGTYWSSSTYPSAIISAWGVGFSAGNSGSAGKTTLYSVRCVSSSSAGSVQALTDNDDGTVTDTTTNLVWQKCSYGQDNDAVCSNSAGTRTWQQALQYCNALALNGRAWRLPSVVELLSIADKTKSSPALDSTSFPATVSGTYWSSTPYTSDVNKAWIVYSGTGFSASTAKMNNNPVRCVADE